MQSDTKNISPNTILIGLATILIVMGLMLTPSLGVLIDGMYSVIIHPSTLDYDVLQQAGMGVGFFNAGLLLIATLLIFYVTKTEIGGLQIAGAAMILGFAMYGKNILNMWFPIIGVFTYAKLNKTKLSNASALACFSTALAPVFSVIAFGTPNLSMPFSIVIGAVLGILSGFILAFFAAVLPTFHKGYLLYNAGFAAGISGFIINSILKLFHIGHDKIKYVEISQALEENIHSDYLYGQNKQIAFLLIILFLYLIIVGLYMGGLTNFKKLLVYKSKGEDYVKSFGLGASLINVGVIGLIALLYVLITVKGQLSGTIVAAIWTAAGFGAFGVTVYPQIVLTGGVFLASFVYGGIDQVASRGMLLSAIFSIGVSPIVSDFGIVAGLILAFLHTFLVVNTGVLHGWMSLYNNGFSLGLLACFVSAAAIYIRDNFKKI